MIKHVKTNKLYYSSYALKVSLKITTARALDGRNLTWMNGILEKFSKVVGVKQGSWRTNGAYTVTQEDIDTARALFPVLIDNYDRDNCHIRVEWQTVSVFTNDYKLLEYITTNFGKYVTVISQPESEEATALLLKNPRTIIVEDKSDFKYNVTTRSLRRVKPDFKQWISNASGMQLVSKNGETYTLDVKDDNAMLMLDMCIGDSIRRVYEYVTIDELRKR